MLYPAGIVIAALSILISILHLKQSPIVYFDIVACAVVFGGTIAVSIMVLPWQHVAEIRKSLRALFLGRKVSQKVVALEGMRLVQGQKIQDADGFTGLARQILEEGSELISLGFAAPKIEAILRERIFQSVDRYQAVANSLRSLSKYPPAFGLVGTVLGLVSLMRAVSSGAGAEETGTRMAVALVATLYGLLVSNLLINPAGESILKAADEEAHVAEMSVQAALLACSGVSVLEAQEMLNSYLPEKDRINLLAGGDAEDFENTPEAGQEQAA